MATTNETDPACALEKVLSRHGLNSTDLDRECPQSVRNAIAIKLANKFDEWERVGRCLDFSWETMRNIDRENASQALRGIALLDTWAKREGPRATYLKLADVLRRRQLDHLVSLLCIKLKMTFDLVPLSGSRCITSTNAPSGNEFQEFMEAFGQMGRTFFQTEHLDEKSYRKNIKDENIIVRPPVPGPLSAYTYDMVENSLQQGSASNDDLYSLVVSVDSSQSRNFEVYIDAYLHNTALEIVRSRRQLQIHGYDYAEFTIKTFRFGFTATSDPCLKLILPEERPYVVAVEPEDGMIRASDIWRESEHEDLQHRLLDYHIKVMMRGTRFDPPTIKFEGSTDDSQLDIHMKFHRTACPHALQKRMYVTANENLTRRAQNALSGAAASARFIPSKDIQFGYHGTSGRQIRITNNGLGAEKRNADRGLENGIAYGVCPLKGRAEFEVMIVGHVTKYYYSALRLGVMRREKGELIESGHIIPRNSHYADDHCVWSCCQLCNNLVHPREEYDYGYVDLSDLREGDCIGLYLSRDGVLEFTVNGESQGIAAKNIYTRNTDVYAVVDHYGSCFATVITKAVSEYGDTRINLQELCLERLSSWLKSGDEVDRLPLPRKLKHKLKWYLDV